MKIRILDDSVRLRLAREEVDRIGAGNMVEGVTRFPGGGRFRYRLIVDGAAIGAKLSGSTVEINVPASQSKRWSNDDAEISIASRLPVDEGTLDVLIEKDFECLEPRVGEDQSNRFANPKAVPS